MRLLFASSKDAVINYFSYFNSELGKAFLSLKKLLFERV